MAKLITMAKKGEPVALRLAVERLVPVRAGRDRAVSIDLPAVAAADDVAGALAEVVAHAAAGEITLSEAREFAALPVGIAWTRRVVEVSADELAPGEYIAVDVEVLSGEPLVRGEVGRLEEVAHLAVTERVTTDPRDLGWMRDGGDADGLVLGRVVGIDGTLITWRPIEDC